LKIFVQDLPGVAHARLVERFAALRLDFWRVEAVVYENLLRSPVRTHDPDAADLFFVPFFSMCLYASYAYRFGWDVARPPRLVRVLAEHAVRFHFARMLRALGRSPYWQRRQGRDHVFIFGQGRGANQGGIWRHQRDCIGRAIFLGVEAKPWGDAGAFDSRKDLVIPPFLPWVEQIEAVGREARERDLLLHFRGRAWGELRPRLLAGLGGADDVLVSSERIYDLGGEGRPANPVHVREYYSELARSTFSLCPAGWTPWSKRFYESILVGSIPVVVPGDFQPPFADRIDYESFTLVAREEDLPDLVGRLRAVPAHRIEAMRAAMRVARHRLIFHAEPRENDAFAMLIDALGRKLGAVRAATS